MREKRKKEKKPPGQPASSRAQHGCVAVLCFAAACKVENTRRQVLAGALRSLFRETPLKLLSLQPSVGSDLKNPHRLQKKKVHARTFHALVENLLGRVWDLPAASQQDPAVPEPPLADVVPS